MRPTPRRAAITGLMVAPLALAAVCARAGELGFALRVGTTLPFYEQTFPVPVDLPSIPGVSLRQSGPLALEAGGGVLAGASVRWWSGRMLGIEARYDSGTVEPSVQEPVLLVAVDLGALGRSPEISFSPHTTLEIGRLAPLSLNLALRSGKRPASIVVSGGLSYLPPVTFRAREELSIDLVIFELDLPALEAGGQVPARVGANLGLAVELPLGRNLAFQVEGRAFVFQSETLDWSEGQLAGAGPLEELLVDAIRDSLDPVEFTPGSYHVAGGVVLRF